MGQSEMLVNDNLLVKLLNEEKFSQFISILELFAFAQCKADVSNNAMKLIYKIFAVIPKLSVGDDDLGQTIENKEKLEDTDNLHWNHFWKRVFLVMTKLCKDKRPLVRNQAITLLQKVLLSDHLSHFTPPMWDFCFTQVLFPFLNELIELSTQNSGIDSSGLEQTRFRALNLVSKVFLMQLQPSLIKLDNFCKIWLQTLFYNRIYMNLGSKLLFEAVPETLKNILLVMFDFNILKPGNILSGKDIWEITWTSVSEFCPNLKNDLAISINPVFAEKSSPSSPSPPSPSPSVPNTIQQNDNSPPSNKINIENNNLNNNNNNATSSPNLNRDKSPSPVNLNNNSDSQNINPNQVNGGNVNNQPTKTNQVIQSNESVKN